MDDSHAELGRRARYTDEKIALLPSGEREEARKKEVESATNWGLEYRNCVFCSVV